MSYQQAILIGNLGQDPETRYSNNGSAISNITVATSKKIKNKETGETEEKTTWHRVVLFNRLGEVAGKYLKKGSKVMIVGQIQTRKWQDQQGQDRYTTEIVADKMQMLDSRPDSESGGAGYAGANQSDGRHQTPQPANDFDDDLPF